MDWPFLLAPGHTLSNVWKSIITRKEGARYSFWPTLYINLIWKSFTRSRNSLGTASEVSQQPWGLSPPPSSMPILPSRSCWGWFGWLRLAGATVSLPNEMRVTNYWRGGCCQHNNGVMSDLLQLVTRWTVQNKLGLRDCSTTYAGHEIAALTVRHCFAMFSTRLSQSRIGLSADYDSHSNNANAI